MPVRRPFSASVRFGSSEVEDEDDEESGMVIYGSLSWIVNQLSAELLQCRPIVISVFWMGWALVLLMLRGAIVDAGSGGVEMREERNGGRCCRGK